ncbi:hypothetical protein JCM10914A_45980 [Paenibacillus sp. JCM 10914]|uniref:hypothetical protein n=1 Tax=Paenibacillus sp. JCM 10914 TaxID=1236974 RepID=UPI00055EE2A6|nr:hypothetical protein [Paenibacillus sp. JCM 10914]
MNKKRLRISIIITSCCLVLIGAFFIIREPIDTKQVVDSTINDTTPPNEKEALEDWQIEYDRRARTEPVGSVVTKHGEFYYAPFPKQFPPEEVVSEDLSKVTKDTKQLTIRGYYYEKKQE